MKKRSFIGEARFWLVLIGADALAMYMIHREYGEQATSCFMDTMPVMFCVGALVPLLAAVFRYLPRRKGLRIAACGVSVVLAVAIGIGALYACYSDDKINNYYWKMFSALNGKDTDDRTLVKLYQQGRGGELATGEVAYGDKLVFCFCSEDYADTSMESSFEYAVTGENGRRLYGGGLDRDRLARKLEDADTVIFYYPVNTQISTVYARLRNTQTYQEYSESQPVYGTDTMMFAVDLKTNTATEPVSVAYREPEDTSHYQSYPYYGGIDSSAVYSAVLGDDYPVNTDQEVE